MLSHTLLLYVVNPDSDAAGWLLFPDHQWQHPKFFHWALSRALTITPSLHGTGCLRPLTRAGGHCLLLQASLPSWDPIPSLFWGQSSIDPSRLSLLRGPGPEAIPHYTQ